MPPMHRGRCIAVLQGIDDDTERPTVDAVAQLADRWRCGAIDIVLDGLDLGEGRKAPKLNALAVGDHGGSGKGVIEQAAIGLTWFDRAHAGGSEVAEAWAAPIDACQWLGELAFQIGGAEIEFIARRFQQKRLPPQRRQATAGRRDAVDQGTAVRRQRGKTDAGANHTDTDGRIS